MKATKSKWLYIKIGLYGALLYSVISIMQYVRTPSFSGNVDMFMGSPSQARHLDWCSKSVQIIFVVPTEATVRDLKAIQELCHLSYSSYNSEEVAQIQWSPFLKSLNERGEETVLEADPGRKFVKKGGLIYKVDELNTTLSALKISNQ
jgi:hypothetical protein